MKQKMIQTKRRAQKGFRSLYAKTSRRRQRAATTADNSEELEGDIPKVGIVRALSVILILHVIAIVAIYMGTKWKSSDSAGENSVIAIQDREDNVSRPAQPESRHRFRVSEPRSYQEFERGHQVTRQPLTAESLRRQDQQVTPNHARRVVEQPYRAVVTENHEVQRAPRVIRPRRNPNAVMAQQNVRPIEYKSYKVVSGDTIYRIAQKNNVKADTILNINNIADARKLRIGMMLKVPIQ